MTTIDSTTRKPAIEAVTNADALTLTLTFANGEVLSLDAATLSQDIIGQATLHGLKQKLVDAAAISRNPDTGRSATIEDKYNAVREVYDRLLTGSWNKTREGVPVFGGLLFRALCIAYPSKTPEAVRTFLDSMDAKQKTKLRETTRIAQIIATLRAEKGTDTDGEALLAQL